MKDVIFARNAESCVVSVSLRTGSDTSACSAAFPQLKLCLLACHMLILQK